MAIEDPTAIPETADDAQVYVNEGDNAWIAEDHHRARQLYHSAATSDLLDSTTLSRVAHRIGLAYMGEGNNDEAYRWFKYSQEPGVADLLRAIDGGTVDAPVNPTVVPQTAEELDRYADAMAAAKTHRDYATFDALVSVMIASPAANPGAIAGWSLEMAWSLQHRGEDVAAREWAEHVIATSGSADKVASARDILVIGNAGPTLHAVNKDVDDGIDAFNRGDVADAKRLLQQAVNDPNVQEVARGQAHYYLGSIAYQAKDYDVARDHFHVASRTAPETEMAWADAALLWRYQEEPTLASSDPNAIDI